MLNFNEIESGAARFLPLPTGGLVETDRVRILVVDDEPSVTDALRIILEDDGYEVAVALTGRDGLELARERSFDLVLTDLRLPDISGLEVLTVVREEGSACAVILITSHSTPALAAEARGRGAFDVLPKPFHPSDVLRLVSLACRKEG